MTTVPETLSIYLHAGEKKTLYNLAYHMDSEFTRLMKLVNVLPKEFACVGLFETAQASMSIINHQICDSGKYTWNLQIYRKCSNDLGLAIAKVKTETTNLNAYFSQNLPAYTAAEILRRAQLCHDYQYKYHQAWSDINQFTLKNTLPEAKRRTGSHTFNQKKNTYGRVVT
jgi:hypothetical protein